MGLDTFQRQVFKMTDSLFRFAFWQIGQREEAEDVVQETFLRMWRMRSKLERYEKLEGLAFKILRNLCIDRSRKRKIVKIQISESTLGLIDALAPDRIIELRQECQKIESVINELPEQQRTIFYLKNIEDYEIKEIAVLLNLKVNTVEVNLSRARKKLRKDLKNNTYGKVQGD